MEARARRFLLAALVSSSLTATAPGAWAQQQQPAATPDAAAQVPQQPTLAPMIERVKPAVVNIATSGRVMVRENPLLQDPFFRRFFDMPESPPPERLRQSLGSGVIVDAAEGYILTNHHVVNEAEEIMVTLADGREVKAELVGSDPATDLAVLQIPAEDLTAIEQAEPRQIRVGDYVVAIGNPFGLGQTVTSGIVSALGRSELGIEGFEDFIQTDASINPGNSGGALVNLQGELVGINTAILSPGGGGNVGIGFAIPIYMAKQVAAQLIEHGEVQRGQLGVVIQDLTPALADALGLEEGARGVAVAQVQPGSAAADAGLEAGDVITAVDGEPVRTASGLRNVIGLMRAGKSVELSYQRGGEERQVEVTIRAAEEQPAGGGEGGEGLAGVRLDMATVSTPGGDVQRPRVTEVQPGSAAAQAGLRPGDVILSVNRQPVSSIEELRKRIAQTEGRTLLQVKRGEGAFFMVLE